MQVININLFPEKLEIQNVCLGTSVVITEYYKLWQLVSESSRFRKEVLYNLEKPTEYIININNKCYNYKEFLDRKRYFSEWLYY